MQDVLVRLQEIFRDVFDDSKLELSPESNANSIEGWDSLAHMNLISVIEQELKIRFALGELETLKNVGDMIELIQLKLKPIN